jgi:hypothetical protein
MRSPTAPRTPKRARPPSLRRAPPSIRSYGTSSVRWSPPARRSVWWWSRDTPARRTMRSRPRRADAGSRAGHAGIRQATRCRLAPRTLTLFRPLRFQHRLCRKPTAAFVPSNPRSQRWRPRGMSEQRAHHTMFGEPEPPNAVGGGEGRELVEATHRWSGTLSAHRHPEPGPPSAGA